MQNNVVSSLLLIISFISILSNWHAVENASLAMISTISTFVICVVLIFSFIIVSDRNRYNIEFVEKAKLSPNPPYSIIFVYCFSALFPAFLFLISSNYNIFINGEFAIYVILALMQLVSSVMILITFMIETNTVY